MKFLKIQAEKKQIILTSHSPQSLDILDESELNKIIIAYSINHETQLKHLNESELIKAKKYIEDMYLSDFWIYSDLEK